MTREQLFGTVGGLALLVPFPSLFVLGAWLTDRRSRRKRESAYRRSLTLAGYCGWVIIAFASLTLLSWLVPVHGSRNEFALTVSYGLGMSCLALFFIAAAALVIFAGLAIVLKYVHHE